MATTSFDIESLPDPKDGQAVHDDQPDAYAVTARAMMMADIAGIEKQIMMAAPRGMGKSAMLGMGYGSGMANTLFKDSYPYPYPTDAKSRLWSEGLDNFFGSQTVRGKPLHYIRPEDRERLYTRFKRYARARSGRHHRKAKELMAWLVAERMTRDMEEIPPLQYRGSTTGRWSSSMAYQANQAASRMFRTSLENIPKLLGQSMTFAVMDEIVVDESGPLTVDKLKSAKDELLKALGESPKKDEP